MKVESGRAKDSAPRPRGRKRRWAGRVLVAIALLALLVVAGANSAAWQQRLMQASGAPTPELALRSAMSAPARFLRAAFSSERAPQLQLDIKFKYLHEIHGKREAALQMGWLEDSRDDFVPATIKAGRRRSAVELRLIGGDAERLRGKKWPLAVHVTDAGHVFGMRRFHLLAPEQRGFQAEALFLEQLRREDVLAPRYFFVETVFNGKHLGLMAFEESFSTDLLERLERRDGVILRLSVPPGYAPLRPTLPGERRPEILPMRAKHIADSKKLSRNLVTASSRLRDFLDGALDAAVVFDVEAIARFLAVVEAFGAGNALEWSQLRFYFNPLTAMLEPIGFAGDLQRAPGSEPPSVADMPFGAALLENPTLRRAYLEAAQRAKVALVSGSDPVVESEDRWLRMLHREYPLRSALLAATGAERGKRLSRVVDKVTGMLTSENRFEASDIGGSMHSAIIPAESVEENVTRHPFLRWDAEARELAVLPGRWAVDGSIFLPRGVGLRIPAGVVLSFSADKGLVARGPLHFEGTAEAPIVLEGPPSAKRKKLWSGVYVVESKEPSRWSHVTVRNTGGFQRRGWELPGGVVFRKTHVDFEHCRFMDNRSDDSLNLVRSTFTMQDVRVRASEGDAIDLDYSRGTIVGGLIEGAGGDGIDLGGSELEVQGMRLSELSDKAIVVGEHSRLSASKLTIDGADIGLASKNGSHAELRDSELRNIARVALLAYANRSDFDGGVLVATNNRVRGAARLALSERESEIVIDGVRVQGENISIASLEDLAASDR